MTDHYHRFAAIHTYLNSPIPENIVATNYQCTICGAVFTEEQAQDYLKNNCYWCNGSGKYHFDYEPYPSICPHCKLENNLI